MVYTSPRFVKVERFRINHCQVENIINQFQQQRVVTFDNPNKFFLFFFRFDVNQQIRETYNRIQRRSYLMAHISQESRFQAVGLFSGSESIAQALFQQFPLCNGHENTIEGNDISLAVILGLCQHIFPRNFFVIIDIQVAQLVFEMPSAHFSGD